MKTSAKIVLLFSAARLKLKHYLILFVVSLVSICQVLFEVLISLSVAFVFQFYISLDSVSDNPLSMLFEKISTYSGGQPAFIASLSILLLAFLLPLSRFSLIYLSQMLIKIFTHRVYINLYHTNFFASNSTSTNQKNDSRADFLTYILNRVESQVLTPLLSSYLSIISIILYSVAFWISSPFALLSLLVLFIFYYLIFIAIRSRLKRLGLQMTSMLRSQYSRLLLVFENKNTFLFAPNSLGLFDQSSSNDYRYRSLNGISQILSIVPKNSIEFLIYASVSIVFVFGNSSSIGAILPSFLLLVRFLPLTQSTSTFLSMITFNSSYIDQLFMTSSKRENISSLSSSFYDFPRASNESITSLLHAIIESDFISFSFSLPSIVEKHASHSSPLHKITCFKYQGLLINGESGSGKSTFLNSILGLNRNSISLSFSSLSLNTKESFDFLTKSACLLTSSPPIVSNSILNSFVDFHGFDINTSFVADCLVAVGLQAFCHDLTQDYGSSCSQLSSGERQRVGLAMCLYKKPLVLFCDEPFSSLDEKSSVQLTKLILTRIPYVLMITHSRLSKDLFKNSVKPLFC